MNGSGRNVVVKDGRGSVVDVGNGSLNNNNLILIIIAIIVVCCLCGGNNNLGDPFGGRRGRGRRRGSGAGALLYLLIPFLLLRGGNNAPNTNTNIINIDPLLGDEGGGGLLDL